MITIKISKRKLESYKRAEKLAREARHQLSSPLNENRDLLMDYLLDWMDTTGKIKYERPDANQCGRHRRSQARLKRHLEDI